MNEMKESIPRVKFLGYRCNEFILKVPEDYINGENIGGLSYTVNYGGVKAVDSDNRFSLNFQISIKNIDKIEIITAQFLGMFESTQIVDDEFIESNFVKINAPAILYPFVRAYVSTVTVNACIPPVLVPTINFTTKQ